MLRSLASRKLSARQKSTLRHVAYRIGRYTPRRVERIVEAVVRDDGARTFLQIGANDGYYSDPLNLAIFRHRLTGTFVEPQPNYFAALRQTYAGFPGMHFVPCAVTAEPGAMLMYTLDCTSGRLPGWACGVGSLSRDQILRSGDQIPDIERYIRSTRVACITVPDLLARTPIRDPDILVVDAEGFDFPILAQFDFAALSAKLVVYESDSMAAPDAETMNRRLTEAGFAVIDTGQDTVALRRDTRTFRAQAQ